MAGEIQLPEVDPREQMMVYLGALKRGWFSLLTFLLVGLILGIGAYNFVPQAYYSTAVTQLRSGWMFDGEGLSSLEDIPLAARARHLEEELKSFGWIRRVLDDLEWTEWSRIEDPKEQRAFLENVKKKIKVNIRRGELGERLIYITFNWQDAIQASDFTKKLRDEWLTDNLDLYQRILASRVDNAQINLDERRSDLNDIERQLERFEINEPLVKSTDSLGPKREEIDTQIIDLEAQVAQLSEEYSVVENLLRDTDEDGNPKIPRLISSSELVANSDFEASQKEMQVLLRNIDQMRAQTYTKKHPDMQSALRRLAELAESASGNSIEPTIEIEGASTNNPTFERFWNQLQDLLRQRAGVEAKLTSLLAHRNRIDRDLGKLPQLNRQYRELQQEAELRRNAVTTSYVALIPLQEKLSAMTRPGLQRVLPYEHLQDPIPATTPTSPVGLIALAVCVVLSLGIGVTLLLAKALLDSSFVTPDQAKRSLGLPVLGEVASIMTTMELRRLRSHKVLQVAASIMLVIGLGAAVYVCIAHHELLPEGLRAWADSVRNGMG